MNLYDQIYGGMKKRDDLERKIKEIGHHLKLIKTNKGKAKARLRDSPLDSSLHEKYDSISLEWDRFKQARRQMQHTVNAIQQNILRAKHIKSYFDLKMKGLFQVSKLEYDDGGWGIRIEYVAKCPAYGGTCALSAADSKRLLSLQVKEFDLPISCRRYAQYLQRSNQHFYGSSYK